MPEMEPFELDDALRTGVAEMDQQHRILIGTLRELEARRNEPHLRRRQYDRVVHDMLAYAIYHFASEEELMKRYAYDRLEPEQAKRHIEQHRAFSQRMVELHARAERDKSGTQAELLGFLRDWLVNHIAGTDRCLGEFIRARTAPAPGGEAPH